MSKASSGIKLVKWLANQADDVAASADDLQRFGPQAAKVRSLLDFLPKMSDDAARVSGSMYNAVDDVAFNAANNAADNAAFNAARNNANYAARSDAWDALDDNTYDAARNALRYDAHYAADHAANATSVGDLIDPNTYRILTNPLATGREADIVNMNAPENFMGILRNLNERSLIMNPQDVRSARKLADLSDYERDPVMEYINTLIENDYYGYRYPGSAYKSLKQMIKAARLI